MEVGTAFIVFIHPGAWSPRFPVTTSHRSNFGLVPELSIYFRYLRRQPQRCIMTVRLPEDAMQKLAELTKAILAAAVLVLGTAAISRAGYQPVPTPEVDPTNGIAAMALVAGAVLMIRGRSKK
jgi:hypothetical protein